MSPQQKSFSWYCVPGAMSNGVQSVATLPRSWTPTREERLIKFSGIGPVDETGMPIASRSVRQRCWKNASSSTPVANYGKCFFFYYVVDIFMPTLNPSKVTLKICLPSALPPPTRPLHLPKSVNKPRDWYKSMFRQIHRKPEGKDAPPPPPLLTHNSPSFIGKYCKGDTANRLGLSENKSRWKTPWSLCHYRLLAPTLIRLLA